MQSLLRAISEEASERSSLLNNKYILDIYMNLTHLNAKLKEIETRPNVSIFESIGRGDQYFTKWEREIHPRLCEVALQPAQIQQLFKSIETGAGRNRSCGK